MDRDARALVVGEERLLSLLDEEARARILERRVDRRRNGPAGASSSTSMSACAANDVDDRVRLRAAGSSPNASARRRDSPSRSAALPSGGRAARAARRARARGRRSGPPARGGRGERRRRRKARAPSGSPSAGTPRSRLGLKGTAFSPWMAAWRSSGVRRDRPDPWGGERVVGIPADEVASLERRRERFGCGPGLAPPQPSFCRRSAASS